MGQGITCKNESPYSNFRSSRKYMQEHHKQVFILETSVLPWRRVGENPHNNSKLKWKKYSFFITIKKNKEKP